MKRELRSMRYCFCLSCGAQFARLELNDDGGCPHCRSDDVCATRSKKRHGPMGKFFCADYQELKP
jgi:predicted Zn-ribbon and HTH transcriptional regulator